MPSPRGFSAERDRQQQASGAPEVVAGWPIAPAFGQYQPLSVNQRRQQHYGIAPDIVALSKGIGSRGFVLGLRPGVDVLRLAPALTIDRKDIEGFLETLEDVLTQLT